MHFLRLLLIALLFFSCKGIVNKTEAKQNKKIRVVKVIPKVKKELFLLNEKNAIPFFYEFGKKNIENKVKIIPNTEAKHIQSNQVSFLEYLQKDSNIWIKDINYTLNSLDDNFKKTEEIFSNLEN